MTYFAGIDIGGTFTDVVLVDMASGQVHSAKQLTTQDDPSEAALQALGDAVREAGASHGGLERVVHATTLATNVILERKGARVAFVTTEGFGDLLALGRDRRGEADRYDLFYTRPDPPVARGRTLEVRERVDARGEILTPLDAERARHELAELLEREDVEAIAICLLHAYANPGHEQVLQETARALRPDAYVARSSEIWPEYREYERATTTLMAAYVGPVVVHYLGRLEDQLRAQGVAGSFQIMQSNGGLMSAATARARPIHLVESGPAAGVIAAADFGRRSGTPDVISFDMGGTTAKAGLVRGGQPDITHDFWVGGSASSGDRQIGVGHPIKIPVIDLAEVGAGGGSIAHADPAGGLHVGPESAGSQPGPACYCRGGERPTVTDANVLLGYLNPDYFLGGRMRIDPELSLRAIQTHVAGPLGMDPIEAAAGIHDIVNANMAGAIRIVTVERGVDPRDFSLVAFGGAGPAHAVRVAAEYDIGRVVVPPDPGVSSALGLLVSDVTRDSLRTQIVDPHDVDVAQLEAVYSELESAARRDLGKEGLAPTEIVIERQADLRFRYQAHTLSVPMPSRPLTPDDLERAAEAFRAAYHSLYGVEQDDPVQLVSYRVRAIGRVAKLELRPLRADRTGAMTPHTRRGAYFRECGGFAETPVYRRAQLRPDDRFEGPAIVEEPASTSVIPPGHQARIDAFGSIVVEPRAGS